MQELVGNDYKVILKEELAARCRQNPRYSLRAFARDLKIAPSRLSEILSGKQGLSRPAAERIAKALGYAPAEIERFCDLVESLHARSRKNRDNARVRLKSQVPSETHQLHLDTFRAISDWYHFGILELINLSDFKSDPKWIGKRLGISEFEVQLALDRLLRLNLITRKGDKLRLTYANPFTPDDIPSDSVKKFHAQILMKAKDAMLLQPVEEREYGAEFIAIDREQLAEAKKALRDFQHKFCKRFSEDAQVKDGLYCLSLQFFDLLERGGGS